MLQLLKAQGVTQSKLRKQPAQDPSNAGERGLPEFPQVSSCGLSYMVEARWSRMTANLGQVNTQ